MDTLASAAIVMAPGKKSVIIRRMLLKSETVTNTYFELEFNERRSILIGALPFQL